MAIYPAVTLRIRVRRSSLLDLAVSDIDAALDAVTAEHQVLDHAARCWSAALLLRVERDMAVSVSVPGCGAEPFAIPLTTRSTIQMATFGRRATAEGPEPMTLAQKRLALVLGDRPAAAPIIIAGTVDLLFAVGTPLDLRSHRLSELDRIADALARVYERCKASRPGP